MAQGQFLSVIARLYEFHSGDLDKRLWLRNMAQKIMTPFEIHECEGGLLHWICSGHEEDCAPFYAEYPTRFPSYTLNGSIVSLVGLGEWAQVASDEKAALLFWTGLEGIRKLLFLYDSPPRSFYDLTHLSGKPLFLLDPNVARDSYHNFHISLLEHLYLLTEEELWSCVANKFKDLNRLPGETFETCRALSPEALSPSGVLELFDFNYLVEVK
jgi:hypothetical protein